MLHDKPAHGYYQVGDRIYLNKLEALYDATKNKQDVDWKFHDDVYGLIDWTVRPPGSLLEMYKQRAQQIRDEYDYVIVHFGGGMDSWTVLNSFLSNGIHVDEVYTRWPRAERKYLSADSRNFNEINLGSEFEYATLPVLEHIKKYYPQTYIYIDDLSECFHNDFHEKTLLESNNFQSMGTYYRFGRKSDREQQISFQKKIAVVLGHDKTCVSFVDGKWYAYFVDVGMGTDNDLQRTNEWFYWTPKFPFIPVLQAHCLIDELELESKFIQKGPVGASNQGGTGSDNLRLTYAKACYPDYNRETFQAGKPLGTLIRHSEAWISQYNPRYFQSWKWNVWQLLKNISSDHLRIKDKLIVGTEYCNSRKYLIK